MHHTLSSALPVLAAGVYSAAALAQPAGDPPPPSGDTPSLAGATADEPAFRLNLLTLQWENDVRLHTLVGPDLDRRYSNGIGIELSATPGDRIAQAYIEPLDFFDEFEAPRLAVGGMLRHYVITPEETEVTVYDPDDQSFTGLLSLGAFLQRAEGRTFDHLQLDAGYIGQNSGAQAVQEFVHAALPGQGDPSWVAQQASGLGVFLTYQRRWKLRWEENDRGDLAMLTGEQLDASAGQRGSGFELIPYAGFRAGNVYDDLSFGAIARLGWPLPDDFGQSRIFDFTDHTRRASDGFGFSLYAAAGGRLVARNAIIEGNILGGDRRLAPKPLVGEFQAGVQFEYRGCLFGYSQTLITEEFNGQNGVSRFGTFSFTYNLAY